jgi:hypothetical protein
LIGGKEWSSELAAHCLGKELFAEWHQHLQIWALTGSNEWHSEFVPDGSNIEVLDCASPRAKRSGGTAFSGINVKTAYLLVF